MDELIERHREWLQRAVAFSGLSPTALAKKAGVAQTTVTRLYFNRPPVFALRADSIAKLEKASGLPFTSSAAPSAVGLQEGEAARYVAHSNDLLGNMIRTATGDLNGVDPWVMHSRALEGYGVTPGDILIVDMNVAAQRGDIVCAQVGEWERGERVETMFRLFEPPYLIAQTNDPALRAPIPVDGRKATVRGVVVAVLRPRAKISQAA